MFKDGIEKKNQLKKGKKTTQAEVNLSNSWFRSWDWDNPIEKKIKINHETQFSVNPVLKSEIEKII
jgi:hypothetical protein